MVYGGFGIVVEEFQRIIGAYFLPNLIYLINFVGHIGDDAK